ncbi:MAG: glutamine--fructose-6-phosphate transaminase (isomerizing) [Oligoflexia bacterium]|nr:glutamine--fructose-6-phosphate transaminase (isomerizing) [Oligoflexia bacterium]
MCGIVGYWGPNEPKKVILSGLRRLEYRGYDSTGVAIFDQKELKVFRSPGKLVSLEEKIKNNHFSGPAGIGHTRWATHGEPNEKNAHPHKVDSIAIVHNGIIENYVQIRQKLIQEGAKLSSDTDSELVAHLLVKEIKKGSDILKATLNVIPQLHGAYSILVINEKEPDTLLAFKNGTPMLVGLGQKEVVIASDVQAIIEHTNKIVYLEDGEIVLSHKSDAQFFDIKGKKISKDIHEINWTTAMAEKAGFNHFMEKEIYEQPRALGQTMAEHIDHKTKHVVLKNLGLTDAELLNFNRIQLIACGSAWHAALCAKYFLESLAKIPCDIDIASEFRYRSPILEKTTLFVTVSQSGETADTLACLRFAKKAGLKILSICNVQHSSIDREANARIYTNAGPEIGVCSTKAFTAQIVALQLLALHLARVKNTLNGEQISDLVSGLLALPSQVEVCLNHDKWFKDAAQTLAKYKGFLYLGRGALYPIALEGALKLKEITYLHAEGFASGELKHGPIALVDKDMAIIAMCPKDELYEKNISNIEEVRARGGQIIAIGTEADEHLKNLSQYYLAIPKAISMANPILASIPVQLLSYHLACELNRDVDKPRNLAKSVTVE